METERLYDSMGFPFGFIQDNGANKTVYVNYPSLLHGTSVIKC